MESKILDLCERVEKNNIWRQRECVNLIPSETTPSLLVKLCEISDPAGRYAEHRTMKGKEIYFYQGTDFIREVEEELAEEMKKYFGCTNVELRPISGQMANEIVFKAIVKFINRDKLKTEKSRKMRAVINNELTKGGHLSSQPMGALFNYVEENPETGRENVFNFPVRKDNPYKIDTEKLYELIHLHKPELIIFGKSMFIYREPVEFVKKIVEDMNPRPIIMFDMAHVLGLYGAFQEPFKEGADVVTGSTHKTFFGPQRGVIAGNMDEGSELEKLWVEIKSRAFPGSTSNHHLGTLLGLLLATYEMNIFKNEYQTQVIKNAKAFAKALKDRGIKVEGDGANGFTETHQVLIRVREYGTGEEIARRFEENNIITNYQALPDDESFVGSSGIRMGVQEMTRFGMKEKDFEELAELIYDCIIKNINVKEKVRDFRKRFLRMHYCLEPEKAIPIAVRLLSSIFPESDYFKKFTNNLFSFTSRIEE
ncbi:MAG: serine hydroxymethyltransferase [Candidatus Aminicenantia bacterium]